MAQTADGYLWLGSADGLYRFDGFVFERYQPQSGGPFPARSVISLFVLPNGDLWIGLTHGISLLRNGHVTNYTSRDGVPDGWKSFAQDREGTIWAATESGLKRLEGSRWKDVGKDWNFPGRSAYAIFLDRQGTLWVSTEDTLVFLPPGARRFQPTSIRVGQVFQIAEAANGKLWMAETTRSVRPIPLSDERPPASETEIKVGSQGILFVNDGALWITSLGDGLRRAPAPELLGGKIKEFSSAVESFTAKDGLSADYVRAILQDREGNIWVGTNNGLDRFRKTNLVPVVLPFKPGNTVLATGDAGDALVRDQGFSVRVHGGHADRDQAIPGNAQFAYRDPAGVIWWLCTDAIYRYVAGRYTKVALPPSFPKTYSTYGIAVTEDGSGTLWLAKQGEGLFYRKEGGWQRLETASEFAKSTPRTAFTDWMGRAWFGYEGGTMIILDHGRIQRVFPADDSPVGGVRAINGRGRHTWVGGEFGLAFFDGNRFRRIIPADAESFGYVMGAEETSDGSLWLAERQAVIQVPASEIRQVLDDPSYRVVKYRRLDSFEGLSGTVAGVGTNSRVIQGTDGRLWFAATGGIVWVDPANISTNALPPPVLIRSVRANGRQSDSLTNLVLPPRTTYLQVDYTALSLSVPEKVRFRYRLEGVDKEWQDAGTRREAFYTKLGPAEYRFRVTACNNDGVWNEVGASLNFSIAPAYYQTNWFRALCVAALLGLLWMLHQFRIRELQQRETKLQRVIGAMPTFAWSALPNGLVEFVNQHWQKYTGLSAQETVGSGWQAAVHPEDLERYAERWRASLASGEPFETESRFRSANGQYRWFLTRAVAFRNERGNIVKWYGTSTDIEDRKRAELLQAELAHINRVTTLGELAASISHELKQPIAATITNATTSLRWLKRDHPEVEEACETIKRIVQDGAYANEIIDRLRSLYKKTPAKRELIAVNETVCEMVLLLRGEANRYAVSIQSDLTTDLPKVMADRVQLHQVLMNLMLNGIEAMKETGGVLRVKSRLEEDGHVLISVVDNGVGLPPGKCDQIFDAFFTTKPQGSGMGLAISKSIVESHGGRIWANGDGGRGATFHFALPVAPAETNSPMDAA